MEPRAYSRAPIGDERLFFVPPLGLGLCGTCGRYYGETPARLVETPPEVPNESSFHFDCLCSACPSCGLTRSRGGPQGLVNEILGSFFAFFVAKRFAGLFGILFGVGFALQIMRAKERGHRS